MKQTTLVIILFLITLSSLHAQLFTLPGCNTSGSTTYGPMYSTSSANSTSRTAVIYPSAQLSVIAGKNVNGLYFNRLTTGLLMTGTPTFKIYVKETTAIDFGADALDWATATTGATLVYNSNPITVIGTEAGWKLFPLTTNFTYSGTQNLAVFFEYTNPSSSNALSWVFEALSPCVDTGNSNTTKYSNNTTGLLPTSLASTDYRRPQMGFDFVESCNSPLAVSTTNIGVNSVDASWVVPTTLPTNGYEYYISTINSFPSSSTPATDIVSTGNTVTINNLLQNSNYYLWVRSVCDNGDKSFWRAAATFRTLCAPVTDFVEYFDSTLVGFMPDCWSKAGTSTAVYVANGSITPGTAPNRLYMSINTTNTAYAILPSTSNLQANTHRLRFKAYATSADKILKVGYFTNPSDPATFVLLQEFAMTTITPATALQYTVVPTNVPAGIDKLVFTIPSGATTSIYIDDVKWEFNSPCVEPSQLTVAQVTNTSAQLGWTAGPSNGTWELQYGVHGFALGSGTIVSNINANSYLLSNLVQNTAYQYYVRSICTDLTASSWEGPISIKTQCDDVTEFSEDFEGYATGSSNPMPDCWSRAGNGVTYIFTGSVAPMTPVNRLYMSGSGSGSPTVAYAIMPSVSNLQANTHRLRFKSNATVVGRTLDIGYLTDPSNIGTYQFIDQIVLPGTSATAAEFIVIPGALPVGAKNLVFKNAGVPTSSTILYIDDVVWEPIPTCIEPSSVIASLITNGSASISWTENGTASQWQIEYGAPGFVQGNGTTVTATTNPYVINGLIQNTNYVFYVRAYCSASDASPWIGPIAFKTLCDGVTSFTENFEGYAFGPSSPMPDCWSKRGLGETYIASGSVLPMSASNKLYMYASGTVTPNLDSYAILPPVSNLQANTHRLRFKAYATVINRILDIGYLTDASNLSTYVYLATVNLPGGAATVASEFTVVPGALPAGVTSLVIVNSAIPAAATTTYIDDVKWEAIPTCAEPSDFVADVVTNESATLSWTEEALASAWEIEFGAPGFVNGTGTVVPAPTNPFTVMSLAANTNYEFYIRAVCSPTDKSYWSGPIGLKTLCNDATEYTMNFEGITAGSSAPMPDCWDKGGNGSTYIVTGSVAPMSPVNKMYMYANGSLAIPSVSYLILPSVSNLQANTHQLKFMAYSTLANRVLEVGYLTNPSDLSTFQLLQQVTLPTTAIEFTVIPGALPAGVKKLVIKNAGTSTGFTAAYLDDFKWEAMPTVAPQCAANVAATPDASCGNFATTIVWDATAIANGYKLTIGTTTGGTDILNNVDIGSATSYSFIGVLGTTYYYTVVPFNAIGSAVGCVEQSFTTATTGCYCASLPTSFHTPGVTSLEVGATTYPVTLTTSPYYLDNTATIIPLEQNVLSTIAMNYSTGTQTYNTYIWIDLDDNFNFDASELVYTGESASTSPNVLNATFTLPTTAALGNHRMRIIGANTMPTPNACYSGSFALTLDYTVNVIEEDLNTGSFDSASFNYYPNPATDVLTVSYSNVISEVVVYNLLGQQVLTAHPNATQTQMDVSGLTAGTYLVKVTSDEVSKTIKVVKN